MTNTPDNIELAVQQFIGYRHAKSGFNAIELAQGMGLEKEEWLKIRDQLSLDEDDKESLNDYFGIE